MAPRPAPVRAPRPVLVRIPFSHFCRKAEWGLTQAGIPYDCWDLLPHRTLDLAAVTAEGTVPILVSDGSLVSGSDRILAWASARARPGTAPLYPDPVAEPVRTWEDWAGDVIGPLARREAYRVAYNQPGRFGTKLRHRVAARIGHKQILGILRYYKVRRYEADDARVLPQVLERVAERLRATETGYLFTDAPTAADIATAALLEPLQYAARAKEYSALEGWQACVAFIGRVRPDTLLRRRRHWMRKMHWRRLRAAAATAQEADPPRTA